MEYLNEARLKEMVYGGAVLGGGGGGSIEAGMAAGLKALSRGRPRLLAISELNWETTIATLSIVGSMGSMSGTHPHLQHWRALQKLGEMECVLPEAVIPSEVGPEAVTYGWVESAITGIPVVDAPCNGRAHPLGLMGSLGLHRRPNYLTCTVATGGSRPQDRFELAVRASATNASKIVRQVAAGTQTALAVARNPLPARYVAKHAAVGGLKDAQRVGRILLKERAKGLQAVLRELSREMGGRMLAHGRVSESTLRERNGFTVGEIRLREPEGSECELLVCNEYLLARRGALDLAVFPDLITVFAEDNGLPLGSASVQSGTRVAVLGVPRERLKLGSTMKDPCLVHSLEQLFAVRLSKPGMSSCSEQRGVSSR